MELMGLHLHTKIDLLSKFQICIDGGHPVCKVKSTSDRFQNFVLPKDNFKVSFSGFNKRLEIMTIMLMPSRLQLLWTKEVSFVEPSPNQPKKSKCNRVHTRKEIGTK